MKTFFSLMLATAIGFSARGAEGADSTGRPGDNLDLYAVLELFKNAKDMESFEKSLNSEDNKVNNLDLNGDNEIDYIKVIDHKDSAVHAIVLQVDVSEKETQDIAVIELEKTGKETAQIQITGNEALYGKEYFIEPKEGNEEKAPGPSAKKIVVVNVWFWPGVRYVYAPTYRVWVSPWRWRVYPAWWRPWHPVHWRVYHPRVVHYHAHYHVVHVRRSPRAHVVYHPHRSTSVTVHKRYNGNSTHAKSDKVNKSDRNANTTNKSDRNINTSGKSDRDVNTDASDKSKSTRTEKTTGKKQTGKSKNTSTRKQGGGKSRTGGARK